MRMPLIAALVLLVATLALAKPCPDCQQENAEASLYCQTCGHRFQPAKACPECSRPAPEDARFCAQCGHRFGFNAADEQRLVNETLKARGDYMERLSALATFYKEASVPDRLRIVQAEQAAVRDRGAIPALKAATVEAYAGALGGKVEPVAEADALFARAEGHRKDLDPFRRQTNLLKALELYQALVLQHPQSDKVDECAYYLGQIFASSYLGDMAKAADYYEKCFLWNPQTDKDARFRAAEACEKAKNPAKAAELYRKAAEDDPLPENREVSKERLKRLAK